MNFTTISKSLILASVCFCSFALASCDNEEDNGKSMKLNAASVTVGVGYAQTVTAANCTTPLTAKSANEGIATATVDKNTITIKGVKAGSTTVVVADNAKQTATVAVTVKDNAITIKGLKAGKTTITVTDNKKVTGMIGVTVK